ELAQKRCPICRATFSEARELPDIRSDPGAWFDAMDRLPRALAAAGPLPRRVWSPACLAAGSEPYGGGVPQGMCPGGSIRLEVSLR
ncbi:unnamed protein product, partial [Prorocentrum cordatum]